MKEPSQLSRITTRELDVMSQLGHTLPLLLGIIFHSAVALADPVRVAITPFHAESNGPLVAEMGEGYAMMFFTGALEVEGVEMVERDPGSPLWDELPLGEAGLTTAWEGVDIVVRGRIASSSSGSSFNPFFPYTLRLDIVDVGNAAILRTVEFSKKERSDEKLIGESLLKQAPILLREAITRHEHLKQAPRVVPLFFPNRSPNERLENYELDFKSVVSETLKQIDSPMEPLFFGGSEEAIEEQTLNWLGFTEEDRSGNWKNVADYFIWGEFSEVESETFRTQKDLEVEATIFWLGRDETTGKVNGTFTVEDFKKGVGKLVKSLPDAPLPVKDLSGISTAKKISDLLFERALPLLYDDLREILTEDPEADKYLTNRFSKVNNDYAKNLIFAACLFDPADSRKQYALLNFGERSQNPVFNAQRIRKIETWLDRSTGIPIEDRMPRAAAANLLEERMRLSRQSWWKPASYEFTPVAPYQTKDSIERFTRLMDRVTRDLGEDNIQKVRNTAVKLTENSISKASGYADSFAAAFVFDLNGSKWMEADDKARLFELTWRLIPEGERKDFLIFKKKDIERLAAEIGAEEWQRIMKSPSLVETRDKSESPKPPSPAPQNGKPRYFDIKGSPRVSRQAVRDRFRLSQRIEKDFETQGFVAQTVRMIRPGQLIVRGRYANPVEGVPAWGDIMVTDG